MKKEYNIVRIRAVACLLILVSHVFQMYVVDEYVAFHLPTFVHHFLYSFHVPIFMSISGYLFWFSVQKDKNINSLSDQMKFLISFGKDKVLRLVIPFISIMYLWRKPISMITGGGFQNRGDTADFLKSYIVFHTTGPLWFLYVLFAIFILEKAISWQIWKSKRKVNLSLLVFTIAAVFARVFLHGVVQYVLVNNAFFFLGAYVHENYEEIYKRLFKYRYVGLVAVIISTIIYSGPWINNGYYAGITYVVQAMVDILLVYLFTHDLKKKDPVGWVSSTDGFSMGIYLFHSDIIYLCFWLFGGTHGLLCGIAAIISSLIGSVLMTYFVRKLGMQFLIGEKRISEKRV